MIGETTVVETDKATAIEVIEDATFTIHKLHSSTPDLEQTNEVLTG